MGLCYSRLQIKYKRLGQQSELNTYFWESHRSQEKNYSPNDNNIQSDTQQTDQ